eukprot:1162015-Pelagomonas_calceolata.AAC.13
MIVGLISKGIPGQRKDTGYAAASNIGLECSCIPGSYDPVVLSFDGVEVLQHAGGSEPAAAQALRQVLQFRHPAAAKDVQQAAETSSSACSFLSALLGHKMAGDAMVRAHKGRCRWCCIVTSCLDDNMLEEGIVRFSRCWFQVDKGSNTLEVWLEVCKAGKKLWQPDLAFPLHSPVQPVNHAQWKSPSYVGHMRAYVC